MKLSLKLSSLAMAAFAATLVLSSNRSIVTLTGYKIILSVSAIVPCIADKIVLFV